MTRELPPERLGGQGLDANQFESGDRAIMALLSEVPGRDQTDLVATWRAGAYEVWSRRGMIRFKRLLREGQLAFEIIEQHGENPVARQSHRAISTIDEELAAAASSGFATEDPNRAFIEPQEQNYPHAYERISQVFDSPRAADLIVSPKCYCYGVQPGQHGALDVVQSRAPLFFAGPGIKRGEYDFAPRHVDIAPTIAHLMKFPLIGGRNFTGLTAADRGVAPDVYLKRQDGRLLNEILDGTSSVPKLAYLMLFDGLSNSELRYALAHDRKSIPNIASIVERSAFATYGSIATFPSITWPSHSTILTGAWSGHHDLVNPTFYERATRQTVAAQGQVFETAQFLGDQVETLYEAFKRVLGNDALTVSIHEPQSRGADHAAWERRVLGDKNKLKALSKELMDVSPRWAQDHKPAVEEEEVVDIRGMAQLFNIFDDPALPVPIFVAHELVLTDGAGHDYGPHHAGLREALRRTDARVGMVLRMLERKGLLESTLFVVTADHGMASQQVELRANPTREPQRFGIKGIFAEPTIYLRDMAIECTRARDGRTVRVTVKDNDAAPDGELPIVSGASVLVRGPDQQLIAEAITDAHGIAALATPANLNDSEISIAVDHADFNSRRIRADGSPIRIDLIKCLYG